MANAARNLQDAKDALADAKRQYKDYQRNLDQLEDQLAQLQQEQAAGKPGIHAADIAELRGLIEDVKADEIFYQTGLALAATNLASATTALMQQTATAVTSATGFGFGFNAGIQLDIDASKTSSEQHSTRAVASTLSGQNIRLATGNGNTDGTQTHIQGSQLLANDRIAITTGDLNVTASQNTATHSSETGHGHLTAQVTVYGAASGASVNASFDRSKNSARETTYNNSLLLADNIDLTTSGDTTLRGATVRAESQLDADIGGHLIVESVQDRSTSRNSSAGLSGGFSTNEAGDLSGVNGGFSTGNGMSTSRQTVLTSLTSGGTANINVNGHTQITGGLIATTDENGHDLNQMNFSTGTIGYADLRDQNVSSQTNTGFSSSIGIGPREPNPANTAETASGNELKPGTSNLTYSNSQQNSASKTLATLGHGNIRVGGTVLEQNGELTKAGTAENSPLASLNRDTTHTTKDLWNSDYSQDVDATLDHRLLTEDGQAEIAHQAKEFGKNIQIVASSLPSEHNENPVIAAIGYALNKISYLTVGVIPSDRFDGGLIANIPVLLGAGDINHKVLQVVTTDSIYLQENPELFIPLKESEYYRSASAANQAVMENLGLYVTRDPIAIDSTNATYQNFTNGMFNSEGDAIKNGLNQTGSEIFTLNYNPTHGFLGDLLESGVDKIGMTTGIAKQTGQFIYDVTTARGTAGSNFAMHSQGNLLTASGIAYRNEHGGFMPQSYFVDESKPLDEQKTGLPTFASFGSPVNSKDMEKILQGSEGSPFRYNGAYTKDNDFVGEVLGGNRGQNGQMPIIDQVLNAPNSILLFELPFMPPSPHSTYLCQNHEGASQNCGYRP